jgi:hypothetical protein
VRSLLVYSRSIRWSARRCGAPNQGEEHLMLSHGALGKHGARRSRGGIEATLNMIDGFCYAESCETWGR